MFPFRESCRRIIGFPCRRAGIKPSPALRRGESTFVEIRARWGAGAGPARRASGPSAAAGGRGSGSGAAIRGRRRCRSKSWRRRTRTAPGPSAYAVPSRQPSQHIEFSGSVNFRTPGPRSRFRHAARSRGRGNRASRRAPGKAPAMFAPGDANRAAAAKGCREGVRPGPCCAAGRRGRSLAVRHAGFSFVSMAGERGGIQKNFAQALKTVY